jgi:hypothetical protein
LQANRKAGPYESGYASSSTTSVDAHQIHARDHNRFFGSSLMPSFFTIAEGEPQIEPERERQEGHRDAENRCPVDRNIAGECRAHAVILAAEGASRVGGAIKAWVGSFQTISKYPTNSGPDSDFVLTLIRFNS